MTRRLAFALVAVSLLPAACAGDSDSQSTSEELACVRATTTVEPAFEPRTLVFDVASDYDEAGYDLVAVDADGGRARTLTRGLDVNADDPVVSPDGRHIAFDGLPDVYGTASSVYVIDADGRDVRRLVSPADGYSYGAGWSPDGKRLLYAVLDAAGSTSLWTIGADGSGKRRLVRGVEDAVWSPDGRTIAFVRDEGTDHPSIHVLDVRDGRTRLLARRGTLPRWTPDSACVVFDRSLQGKRSGFYVVDRESARQQVVRRFGGDDDPYLAGVSPDGRWVLAGYLPGVSRISLADGKLERLTNGRSDWAPAWSPDGKRIAFERGGDIWVMNASGDKERVVARAPRLAVYGAPQWRPEAAR